MRRTHEQYVPLWTRHHWPIHRWGEHIEWTCGFLRPKFLYLRYPRFWGTWYFWKRSSCTSSCCLWQNGQRWITRIRWWHIRCGWPPQRYRLLDRPTVCWPKQSCNQWYHRWYSWRVRCYPRFLGKRTKRDDPHTDSSHADIANNLPHCGFHHY